MVVLKWAVYRRGRWVLGGRCGRHHLMPHRSHLMRRSQRNRMGNPSGFHRDRPRSFRRRHVRDLCRIGVPGGFHPGRPFCFRSCTGRGSGGGSLTLAAAAPSTWSSCLPGRRPASRAVSASEVAVVLGWAVRCRGRWLLCGRGALAVSGSAFPPDEARGSGSALSWSAPPVVCRCCRSWCTCDVRCRCCPSAVGSPRGRCWFLGGRRALAGGRRTVAACGVSRGRPRSFSSRGIGRQKVMGRTCRVCLHQRIPLSRYRRAGNHLVRCAAADPEGDQVHTMLWKDPLVCLGALAQELRVLDLYLPFCSPKDAISAERHPPRVVLRLRR